MRQESNLVEESAAQRYIQANVRPPDMAEVNWNAAPRPFKLYRDCEQIPCSLTELARGEKERDGNALSPSQMGQMLADIYGLTRQNHHFPVLPFLHGNKAHALALHASLLRPVPSGGALFPCELYVLVGPGSAQMHLPEGIYHYDAAHHALDILRKGDYSALLQDSLAHPANPPSAYTLLLSSFFWKDVFKYEAFSYRLQGLDIGTVISQAEIVAHHMGFETKVHYQFLDHILNDLLGLDPMQESVYAVIEWGQAFPQPSQSERDQAVKPKAHLSTPVEPTLAQPLAEANSLQSLEAWPLVEAVHRASLIETRQAFRPLRRLAPIQPPEQAERQTLALSANKLSLDLWEARHARRSADGFFLPKPLDFRQLSQLLRTCRFGVTNDLDGPSDGLRHTLLYCVIRRVQDVPSGIYRYQPERHALELVQAWEPTSLLEKMRDMSDPKHFYTSLSLFLVGNLQSGFEVYGDRWYRMQHMEAGIIAQRLYLAVAGLKLGCRASLGFPVQETNTFLGLSEAYTSLLHLMVVPEYSTYQQYEQSLRI